MKIIFGTPRLSYYGATKMLVWVATKMYEDGQDVKIVSYFSNEKYHTMDLNVPHVYLGAKQSRFRFIRNTFGMFLTINKLHKFLKKEKPDVFVTFLDSVGYVYLRKARKYNKFKLVCSERVDPFTYKGRKAKTRFKLQNYAHYTVFQTEGARSFFKGIGDIYENSSVIPNPVILTQKSQELQKNVVCFEEREKRIVNVGRLSLKQKRQDVLIDAFEIFLKNHPDYVLEIYGDGEDREKIQTIINKKGLQESIKLMGKTDKVYEVIFKAKAFVLSSDFEGIPNALIEAMSIGVPSISTDCSPGGARLLINDGENGFLVERESPLALAEKLSSLVDEKEISNKFSIEGIKICDIFSEENIAKKWKDILAN